jgi:hypothetical protein
VVKSSHRGSVRPTAVRYLHIHSFMCLRAGVLHSCRFIDVHPVTVQFLDFVFLGPGIIKRCRLVSCRKQPAAKSRFAAAMIHGSASMVVAADRDNDHPRFQFPKFSQTVSSSYISTFLASCLTCRMFRENATSLLEFIQCVGTQGENSECDYRMIILGNLFEVLRSFISTYSYAQLLTPPITVNHPTFCPPLD